MSVDVLVLFHLLGRYIDLCDETMVGKHLHTGNIAQADGRDRPDALVMERCDARLLRCDLGMAHRIAAMRRLLRCDAPSQHRIAASRIALDNCNNIISNATIH